MNNQSSLEGSSPREQYFYNTLFILIFCLIQSVVTLSAIYVPVADNYVFARDGKVELKNYIVPKDLMIRRNLNSRKGLFAEFVLKDDVIQSYECNRLDFPSNNRNICNIYMNKNNKIFSVELYKRYLTVENEKTSYITKSISYINVENKVIKVVYQVAAVERKSILRNAWNKLIFFNLMINLLGVFILVILYFIKYPKEAEDKKTNKILQIFFRIFVNTPKALLILYVVSVMIFVWYYTFNL